MDIDYVKRFKIALVFGIMVAIIAYYLAVRKTINEFKGYLNLKSTKVQVMSLPEEETVLIQKLNNLDTQILSFDTISCNFRQSLLEKTSKYCRLNGIYLVDFQQPEYQKDDDMLIETNQIVLKGGLHSLLGFLFFVERGERIGKVASASFKTHINRRENQKFLLLTCIIHNIQKEKTNEN